MHPSQKPRTSTKVTYIRQHKPSETAVLEDQPVAYAKNNWHTDNHSWKDLNVFKHRNVKILESIISISSTDKNKLLSFKGGFINSDDSLAHKKSFNILYSLSKHAIVFDFLDDESGIFSFTPRNNYAVSLRSFLNFYNIDPDVIKGDYRPKLENIPNLGRRWVIFLKHKKDNI